ncbi:MAG: hypothetical protein VX466_11270 [Myxococcota bacterium]|nr:hypothetical protein [Myxococcota bacterium]
MLKLAEDARSPRPAGNPVAADAPRHVLHAALLTLVSLFAFALPASADTDLFDELFFQSLGYEDEFERKSPSPSLLPGNAIAVAVPAAEPATSILNYSKPLGNTGLVFRLKARPSPRRLVRFEIRF